MAWSSIRGQTLAIDIVRAHLKRGGVASAYLFTGSDGVGKRLTAIELAKALNCEQQSTEACDQCPTCRQIQRRVHPDVHVLEPQGAARLIGIDDVRHLLGRVSLRPFSARAQVAILDGADRLTEEAANSLLKSLEESSSQSRFVLLAEQPSRCLPTIRSRCQLVRFQRLPASVIEEVLSGLDGVEPSIAKTASGLAQGSLSSARKLAATWSAYDSMTAQFAEAQPMTWVGWAMPTERQALEPWVAGSILWLRDVAVASVGADALIQHQHVADVIHQQARALELDRCIEAAWRLINVADSMEQLISARLVGTLLREEWLQLVEEKTTR